MRHWRVTRFRLTLAKGGHVRLLGAGAVTLLASAVTVVCPDPVADAASPLVVTGATLVAAGLLHLLGREMW